MAYDEELADRFRATLDGMMGISEKRMMGAVCFFLDGNMIGAADRSKTGEGRFMFRVGKENEAEALRRDGASVAVMGPKRMSGFIFVGEEACNDAALKEWVSLALSYVSRLPAK